MWNDILVVLKILTPVIVFVNCFWAIPHDIRKQDYVAAARGFMITLWLMFNMATHG